MSEPLKPCPFCGTEAEKEPNGCHGVQVTECDHNGLPAVGCGTCNTLGPWADTEAEALAAWNRRYTPPGLMLCSEDDLARIRAAEPGTVTPIHGLPAARANADAWPPESHMNAEEGE